MKKLKSRLLLVAAFGLLIFSATSLFAGAGCQKAGSYYTVVIPDTWELASSGG